MKLPKFNRRARESPVVVEVIEELEEEVPTCTFDDDADPSIERCWADDDGAAAQNGTQADAIAAVRTLQLPGGNHPLALAGAGATLVAVLAAVVELLVRKRKARRNALKQEKGAKITAAADQASAKGASLPSKEHPHGQAEATTSAAAVESRVKELKLCLERETKEKQGLSEQNNFLKSALEERKATVQIFTSELQSRDEQLANFEQEQIKVKNELYQQIEALKSELQKQETLQHQNLNIMDGQCADLAGKVEGLMKELASREEQWEKFEKDAKAKENDSAAQIEAIKKEYSAKEQEQNESLNAKSKECSKLSSKLETLSKEMKTCEEQLANFQKQRGKWNEATGELQRLLKEKREEIVGLTTRMELFVGELKSREVRLVSLEEKLEAKKDLTVTELEDLKKTLKAQQEDHDDWNAKTTQIQKLSAEREEETRTLTSKLESLTKELRSSEEKATALESKIRDKEFVITSNKESIEKSLGDERVQRSQWEEQSAEMARLLKARQEECASLTARVEIFAGELQSRETIVENLQVKVEDKENFVTSQLQALEKQLHGKQAFRDTWSESTKGIYTALEEKKEQCVGLSTRVDIFQMELQKREERVASLESVLKEKQDVSAATLEPYQTQLTEHRKDLDKWTNNTNEIRRLLKERKNECVGLTTRLHLFKQKLTEYEENADKLSRKFDGQVGSHNQDMSPLRGQLQKQREERDNWTQKTREIGSLLNDSQGQCIGLKTRLGLFKKQTEYHREQATILEEKAKEIQEKFDLLINPIKEELQIQREGLESWRESTLNVERLLKQAEKECVDLTTDLKRHIVKLQGCQKQVAHLQAKVLEKEDMVEFHKEQYLSERKKEELELDKWSNNTKDLEKLLRDKECQIVGLTTRLSLFEKELSSWQSLFTELDAKVKERGESLHSKILSLENELKFQREQRDHCLETTLRMNKSMKEVKEPCIGVTTRINLFRKELEGREERVKILQEQVREEEENALSELEPIRKELQKQRDEQDKWNQSTLDIFWMLKERQDQTVGLTTRLELFMSELQKKEEAVETAESKLKETEQGLVQTENLKKEIEVQEGQRSKWKENTDEISRVLQQKEKQRARSSEKRLEQECFSLSAKLELFRGELQRREDKVKSLKDTSTHKSEMLRVEKAKIETKIPALKEDRDSWMEKTLQINQTLKKIQAECVGLNTRWELFEAELKKHKERVATIEGKLQERKGYHAQVIDPYKKELQVQTDLRNKWLETTDKMNKLLKKKESECVNFTTQLETSIDELTSRKEQVANLEKELRETQEFSEIEMGRLTKQYKEASENLATWKTSTENINKSLKDKRQECANLRVRLQVFRRQVETQDSRIATLESAYQAKRQDVGAEVEALQSKLREQQLARDESVGFTLDINKQIKAKELQCTSMTVRLSLFRSELENREKTVAALENKLKDKEGMSALQLDPVKAQLQKEKEEMEKWAKNTAEVEKLLKQRQDERVGLATRLQLFQVQLKTVEESVAELEQRVKDREEAAATEMAPFRNALETQRAERDRWTAATMEIHRLLQDRKTQITGLMTRLALFRREVKHREGIVANLESKLREKQEEIDSFEIGPVQAQLQAHQKERDQWKETTSNLVKMLRTKRGECNGLTTRLACFKIELQKREEACNELMKEYDNKKDLYGSQVQVLKSELAMQMEQRDKWRDTTTEMRKQLEERKAQCTGLSTRVDLFQKEMQVHDDAIESLQAKLKANDAAVVEIEELKKELKVQEEHRDSVNKSMEETGNLLKEKKEQCVGLATRPIVFRQQLKERMGRLAATETKIKEKEDLSAAQIESLQSDLQAQREQRNKWSETTEELKKLLEDKENQCSIISSELELLTGLQASET